MTLPSSLSANTSGFNILPFTVPLNGGVGFVLPYDKDTYQISFSTELRINTGQDTNPYYFIDYLTGSVTSPPNTKYDAVLELVVYKVDNTGSIINTSSLSTYTLTWDDIRQIAAIPTIPPTNKSQFQTYSDGTYSYYRNNPMTILPVFQIDGSPLNGDGEPYGRRVVTVRCTSGYSFHNSVMNISKVI
jgi:hypothetical protein